MHGIFNEICESKDEKSYTNVYEHDTSRTWSIMYTKFIENLKEMECGTTCKIEIFLNFLQNITNMLLQIRIDFVRLKDSQRPLYFFEENELLLHFVRKFMDHINNCTSTCITPEQYLKFFLNLIVISNSKNFDIIFHILAYPLLTPLCYKSEKQFPDSFIGEGALGDIKMAIKSFYSFLSSQNVDKNISLQFINEFFQILSSSLLILNSTQIQEIEKLYMKICRNVLESNDHQLICLVIETIPHVLTLFEDVENVISDILKPVFVLQNKLIQEKATSIVPNVVCCLSSDFIKVLKWDENHKLNISICCEKCCSDERKTSNFLEARFGEGVAGIHFNKVRVESSSITSFLLKPILTFFTTGTSTLKIISLDTLPYLSSHVLQFHSANVAKIWIELAGHQDKLVREKFAEVVGLTIKYGQENAVLSQETKMETLDIIFTTLLSLTKRSLQFSNSELQDTLLSAIEEISIVKHERITVELMKLLIYFIMIPTSRHSLIAVNKCFKISKRNYATTTSIYSQNKKELCEVIVHLCSVNQALINYTLTSSLEKVSLMLGFYSPKEFVTQESNYLLPFMVFKNVKMPAVNKLIQEMASLMDLDVSEMLSTKYGYIFIYIFLEEMNTNDFKQCMLYLEKTTGMSGPTLRKRNFRIILNELLLNFHEKKERVVLALSLLADEDSENKINSIPDYLQSHFLGVLLYFDVRLISKNSKKDKILLSLADLLKYMGSKHIMPLRFKIIAMLQTTSFENFPHLNCEVWNAFIHSCEIESLGPQLASIFVSVQPLLEDCPRQINEILKYLIVENEVFTKNYIPDLFFVNNSKVDHKVLSIIKKYLKFLEKCSLKEKIQKFLKYLTHEAMEVRIQGLKQLKSYLELGREELDQMILDYNGIDPAIVELIDILTLGCREKDESLKLACGEVFGELGAIEPSHLPRRYTQDDTSFSFFISEDSFIISALNELIKAMQTEKNTQNMDRYALAIQEILRDHEISPNQSSSKNYLWHQFPESQREVMLPLLSSRYMIAQPVSANNFPTPIYGSNIGASFQSWLYNWTASLISSLSNEHKQLLTVCLPSMKQDKRILMHFLPHILLHALLEGSDINEKSFVEFQTITNSFTKKKKLDPKVLSNFQNKLCKLQLARCNYHCGEYPRALMYLEEYITENKGEIYNHLSFLAEIYAQLEESDGVAGVTALQHNEPSVEQRILALEVSGKLADATTSLNFVKGAQDNQPEFGNMLLEMQAEPLWRLGQYEELDNLLKKPDMVNNKSWGVQVGKALLFLKQGARNEFKITLDGLLKHQIESFGAASLEEGAYQHGYSCISKLHALNELQQVEKTLYELLLKPNDQNYAENLMKKLMDEWMLRIKVVQESVRVIEPLLCLRRVSLNLAKKIAEEKVPQAVPFLNSFIAECWLLSAKTARSAGMHQQAYTYTIKAEEYAPAMLFLEKAKLHWLREEHEQALTTLRRGLETIIPEGERQQIAFLSIEQKRICAEARLLIATYNDTISNVDVEVNLQNYRDAIEVYREWEKSLVCLAQYYDKIFQNYSDEDRDAKGSDMQLHMINYFGKSLLYGTNYVYQSMPRLLSIWFDYGTRLLDVTLSSVKEERKTTLLKMTKVIDSFLERLPAYVFLTAFSQLVSRICHPQKEVYIELKSIIIKLLQQYPQQSLWMIISVIKSSYAVRSKRCSEILCDIRLKTNTMSKLVKDFTGFAEKLIELCNKEIPGDVNSTTVSSLLRSLPRMLNKDDFSEIMMPTHKFRKLILPNPDFKSSQHNPFPNHYVHIVGIEDEIVILQSLQRPRKITLKGSDGKGYIYMLKPKDDLRKDFRLMEFNDIVNQLLAREAEARQRRLNIRLYSVAPLNEECGLIEWIPNLVGLRPVLVTLYKQRGLALKGKELRESCCNIRDSLDKKREIFTKKMVTPSSPNFRGVSWLTARTAYIRTTAVMSMAGYILGLGDRHGENILLDSTCGDVVHVDFNCLFNKGESFDWPERVPFRLTHNMVAAMGPLGVEGVFRKSCACTLRVLRTNANTFMSIVTPFVYDPLVSWPRNMSALPSVHNAERTNEQAVDHIKNIELRLQGKVKTRNRTLLIPLSVEGQTNYLINEAVSVDNLCQMYMGWGPYL
ncbi:hypothetical protein NQ314_009467 [Rhamnusium bicolor]|uniref:Serine/threonine-protein kinase ATR n=1 Tax=Rhamnusium bicolor TaxID=1586634 RepID=A0AAV8Y0P6_9CUCU|nr:hypothetical protein NQ314_009467 [Rhamnusium bicolor]